MRIKCSNCESIFHEDYLFLNGISGESFCPICDMPINLDNDTETEEYQKFKDLLTHYISVPALVNFDDSNNDDLVDAVNKIVYELSTDKKCPHCDAPLYCSDLHDYNYVCVECDENFYECEVK